MEFRIFGLRDIWPFGQPGRSASERGRLAIGLRAVSHPQSHELTSSGGS